MKPTRPSREHCEQVERLTSSVERVAADDRERAALSALTSVCSGLATPSARACPRGRRGGAPLSRSIVSARAARRGAVLAQARGHVARRAGRCAPRKARAAPRSFAASFSRRQREHRGARRRPRPAARRRRCRRCATNSTALVASARKPRSALSSSATPGLRTLTTTSSPVARSVAACTCAIEPTPSGASSTAAEHVLERAGASSAASTARISPPLRRREVEARLELLDVRAREERRARQRDELAELHVRRAEPLEQLALRARREARRKRAEGAANASATRRPARRRGRRGGARARGRRDVPSAAAATALARELERRLEQRALTPQRRCGGRKRARRSRARARSPRARASARRRRARRACATARTWRGPPARGGGARLPDGS